MKLAATMILTIGLAGTALAADCSNNYFSCPHTSGNSSYCDGDSLSSNIIFRCLDGCPQAGNCDDDLAPVPPIGDKQDALCWQESATAGNAACTADCVNVTALNGSVFYPVGCDFQLSNTTSAPSSTSLPLPTSTSTPTPPPLSTTTPSGGGLVHHAGTETAIFLGFMAFFL